jgi:hypothetical protein
MHPTVRAARRRTGASVLFPGRALLGALASVTHKIISVAGMEQDKDFAGC